MSSSLSSQSLRVSGLFPYLIPDSSRQNHDSEERSAEKKKTVSTVYFILGISRTDLWSQGISWLIIQPHSLEYK